MANLKGKGPRLTKAVAARSSQINRALRDLTDHELQAPSQLEGWSRLTIACHLRYGARTLARMTHDALAGLATSYYPEGREGQRPSTLAPDAGESPQDVVRSLQALDAALCEQWDGLADSEWITDVVEPADQVDLGTISLVRLSLLRLSEVEVHGSDLGLGGVLERWSEEFVQVALTFRLDWLNARRSNHRPYDAALEGSWLLVASDGPAYLVEVNGDSVRSTPAGRNTVATATVAGDSRDLLALLLGRQTRRSLNITGDGDFARSFGLAFPGP